MRLARPFLVHGKYKMCGLCHVVPGWELIWVDLGETPPFCSLLDKILSSICWLCSSSSPQNKYAEDSRVNYFAIYVIGIQVSGVLLRSETHFFYVTVPLNSLDVGTLLNLEQCCCGSCQVVSSAR